MSTINYDQRRFRLASEGADGTLFHYHQASDVVWITYDGGTVTYGQAIAKADSEGKLDLRYQHVTTNGLIQIGSCITTPEVLADGRLRLTEVYQSTFGNQADGISIAEEVRD